MGGPVAYQDRLSEELSTLCSHLSLLQHSNPLTSHHQSSFSQATIYPSPPVPTVTIVTIVLITPRNSDSYDDSHTLTWSRLTDYWPCKIIAKLYQLMHGNSHMFYFLVHYCFIFIKLHNWRKLVYFRLVQVFPLSSSEELSNIIFQL